MHPFKRAWCSDGALTILTLRGSKQGRCMLMEDRCWKPRCVLTGWKRTFGKPTFFSDKATMLKNAFVVVFSFSGNGRVFASKLYGEVVLSLTSNRDDCSDGVCRKKLSTALLCKHNTRFRRTAWFPLLGSPGLPFSVLLAPATMSSQDFRMSGAIRACFLVVPSTVTGAQLPCRVGTLHCPRPWLIDLL